LQRRGRGAKAYQEENPLAVKYIKEIRLFKLRIGDKISQGWGPRKICFNSIVCYHHSTMRRLLSSFVCYEVLGSTLHTHYKIKGTSKIILFLGWDGIVFH
jgi:hypothetical protein